jgi:hypothetical protein
LLLVDGTLKNAKVFMLNGEEYTVSTDQKIHRYVDLSVGLNDLLVGLPEQPELYALKILRLQKFNDIAREKDKDSIIAIATLGYMGGDYPLRFNPRRTVSRQEMAAVVVRMNKYSEPIMRGILDEVDILSNQGILKGFPDGLMRPDEKLTKGQLAVVLARLLELPVRESRAYSIVSQEHWADPSIVALTNSGLYAQTEFVPRNTAVTKAELAALLARLPIVQSRVAALYAYDDAMIEVAPQRTLNSYQNTPPVPSGQAIDNDRLLFEEAVRSGIR